MSMVSTDIQVARSGYL